MFSVCPNSLSSSSTKLLTGSPSPPNADEIESDLNAAAVDDRVFVSEVPRLGLVALQQDIEIRERFQVGIKYEFFSFVLCFTSVGRQTLFLMGAAIGKSIIASRPLFIFRTTTTPKKPPKTAVAPPSTTASSRTVSTLTGSSRSRSVFTTASESSQRRSWT